MNFINDFLNYITKTIDMFSSMKFKDKIKCLFEQCIVLGIIVLSFVFIKTGILFLGVLLCIISCLTVNVIILLLLYNFIVNNKFKLKRAFLIFISSLILFGVGCGFSAIGIVKFNHNSYDNNITEEIIIPMNDNILFDLPDDRIQYVESSNDDLKINLYHSKYTDLNIYYDDNYVYFSNNLVIDNFESLRNVIKDINNRSVIDYQQFYVTIYTNKSNIDKIVQNQKKDFNH